MRRSQSIGPPNQRLQPRHDLLDIERLGNQLSAPASRPEVEHDGVVGFRVATIPGDLAAAFPLNVEARRTEGR
jgi:hypothetical protein